MTFKEIVSHVVLLLQLGHIEQAREFLEGEFDQRGIPFPPPDDPELWNNLLRATREAMN
jgi:hypothetical protein